MKYENVKDLKFSSFENVKVPMLNLFVGGASADKETGSIGSDTDAFTTGSVGSYDGFERTNRPIRNDGFDF